MIRISQRAFQRTNKYSLKINKKVMKYVIVTKNWLIAKGFTIQPNWRSNIAGTKYIIHLEHVEPVLTSSDNIKSYDFDSQELITILNSSEWVKTEENGAQ